MKTPKPRNMTAVIALTLAAGFVALAFSPGANAADATL